ncbi:MAG: hypothetical protein AB7S75_22465 [Desulfococcaceae bacterium]
MLTKFRNPDIPSEVKTASLLIISYGITVIILALWYGITNNFYDIKDYVRPIGRFIAMVCIGWWLLSLDKKSWWFAIISCLWLFLFGVIGLVSLLIASFSTSEYDLNFLWLGIRVIIPVYLLGHAGFILSKKATRNYFR